MVRTADLEHLRESLIELDRLRLHERNLRLESEALMRGLRALTDAQDTDTMFDTLADVLRDIVPFADVFLLAVSGRGGLRVVRSTAQRLLGLRWSPREVLSRVLEGETVALFDTRLSPEWAGLSPAVLGAPAFFSPAHVHLLKRFTPLIDQALNGMWVRDRLEKERRHAQEATLARLKEVEERRKAEAESIRVHEMMASAIDFAPIYLWEVDKDFRYTFVQGTEKALGYTREELLGRSATEHFDLDDPATQAYVATLRSGQPYENIVFRRRRKDGSQVWVSVSGRPVMDANGGFGYRGITMDVTETTEAKLKLEQMALHDALTGLANRRKFLDHFESALARVLRDGKPLSVLAIDIDHFKRVNDAHGHPAGDEVLVAMGRILERTVRRTDLVARFGGEEFMVLLPDTQTGGAADLAEKLRRAVEAERFVVEADGGKVPLAVTISVGVGTIVRETASTASFDEVIERADQALYAAKLAGRNRVSIAEPT
jgi:diguanylate cyclase (GGDEF)-like protein/PAS domain S-box-containing protein